MTAISFQSPYTPQPIAIPQNAAQVSPTVRIAPISSSGFNGQTGNPPDRSAAGKPQNWRGYLSQGPDNASAKSIVEAQTSAKLPLESDFSAGLPKVEMPDPLPTAPILLFVRS